MSKSDYKFTQRYARTLSKDKPHELKEFFPAGIWNNKSNKEKCALGRKFKQLVRNDMLYFISHYEVHSNKHTYYYISE